MKQILRKFWKVYIYYCIHTTWVVAAASIFILTVFFIWQVIEKAWAQWRADLENIEALGWLMCAFFILFLISLAAFLFAFWNTGEKEKFYEELEELRKNAPKE